jgi:hypothetical protein
VRDRKSRIGKSGAGDRSSITTNARTSASDPASRPSVVPVVQPSLVARQRVDQQHQSGGDGGCAQEVEMAMPEPCAALLEQQRGERDRRDADRDVDEEDPRPAQVRGQEPTEQHARRSAATGRRTVDPEREVALTALGERRHQQRECGGGEQRPTEALDGAKGDQRSLGPGDAAEERARGEQRQPGDEETPAPEEVGEPAAEQQHAAEQDRVRGDDPLEVRLREAEIGLDRRQRDVHDRDVEDDHELRGDDEGESAPAPVPAFGSESHVLSSLIIVD